MNKSLSKSEAKGLGCEYYYQKYYIEKQPQHVMPWTRVGTEFHAFMEAYTRHLVAVGLCSDPDFANKMADTSDLCDEARDLILRYLQKFVLTNPVMVIGIEAFLVIDKDFLPIRNVEYPGVGRRPIVDGAYGHGTLDRVERVGDNAVLVVDYKTGFLPSRVDEYEAQHYSLLAFAHFPWAQTVTFRWDFPRFGNTDEVTFTRADWPELVSAFQRKLARRETVVAAEKPECNAMAGLCGYCALPCPAREQALRNGTIYRPLQTQDDAKVAASTLAAIRSSKATLEAQLKMYLRNTGTLDMGGGNGAYLTTSFTPQMGARTVLAALGVDVPVVSPEFDVALDSLVVNNTEFKRLAAAKKRAGLLETVLASVPTKARTDLAIGRMPVEP